MDEVDEAFVESLMPDGAICEGFVAAVSFLRPDGQRFVRFHFDGELDTASIVGMLTMGAQHYTAQAEPFGDE